MLLSLSWHLGPSHCLATQDRQRSQAHASTNYIIRYIGTYPRRRFGCHLSAVAMKLRSSRCTTTDVRKRLSYIRDRPPPTSELTCDAAKLRKITIWQNLLKEKCWVPPVFCLKQYKKLSPLAIVTPRMCSHRRWIPVSSRWRGASGGWWCPFCNSTCFHLFPCVKQSVSMQETTCFLVRNKSVHNV